MEQRQIAPKDRFGSRVVQRKAYGEGKAYWRVKCDCGEVSSVRESALLLGTSLACRSCHNKAAAAARAENAA